MHCCCNVCLSGSGVLYCIWHEGHFGGGFGLAISLESLSYHSGYPEPPISSATRKLDLLKEIQASEKYVTKSDIWKENFFLLENQFSSVQSLSCAWLYATPWITAYQAPLSITNSWSSPKLMSIESVMSSSHLILCHLLLLLPPTSPSIRVFSNELTLHIRWPKYWSFSFNISPSNEHPGLISFKMDWLDCLVVQGTLKSHLQHHSLKA